VQRQAFPLSLPFKEDDENHLLLPRQKQKAPEEPAANRPAGRGLHRGRWGKRKEGTFFRRSSAFVPASGLFSLLANAEYRASYLVTSFARQGKDLSEYVNDRPFLCAKGCLEFIILHVTASALGDRVILCSKAEDLLFLHVRFGSGCLRVRLDMGFVTGIQIILKYQERLTVIPVREHPDFLV
jgi:hypothetical protein